MRARKEGLPPPIRVVPSRRGLAVTFVAFAALGWASGLVGLGVMKWRERAAAAAVRR